MGVLPKASCHCLPPAYQPLFSAHDSPILDFYPEQFQIDMNGKRFAWQVLLRADGYLPLMSALASMSMVTRHLGPVSVS